MLVLMLHQRATLLIFEFADDSAAKRSYSPPAVVGLLRWKLDFQVEFSLKGSLVLITGHFLGRLASWSQLHILEI